MAKTKAELLDELREYKGVFGQIASVLESSDIEATDKLASLEDLVFEDDEEDAEAQ